jgi:hypothetical protein
VHGRERKTEIADIFDGEGNGAERLTDSIAKRED